MYIRKKKIGQVFGFHFVCDSDSDETTDDQPSMIHTLDHFSISSSSSSSSSPSSNSGDIMDEHMVVDMEELDRGIQEPPTNHPNSSYEINKQMIINSPVKEDNDDKKNSELFKPFFAMLETYLIDCMTNDKEINEILENDFSLRKIVLFSKIHLAPFHDVLYSHTTELPIKEKYTYYLQEISVLCIDWIIILVNGMNRFKAISSNYNLKNMEECQSICDHLCIELLSKLREAIFSYEAFFCDKSLHIPMYNFFYYILCIQDEKFKGLSLFMGLENIITIPTFFWSHLENFQSFILTTESMEVLLPGLHKHDFPNMAIIYLKMEEWSKALSSPPPPPTTIITPETGSSTIKPIKKYKEVIVNPVLYYNSWIPKLMDWDKHPITHEIYQNFVNRIYDINFFLPLMGKIWRYIPLCIRRGLMLSGPIQKTKLSHLDRLKLSWFLFACVFRPLSFNNTELLHYDKMAAVTLQFLENLYGRGKREKIYSPETSKELEYMFKMRIHTGKESPDMFYSCMSLGSMKHSNQKKVAHKQETNMICPFSQNNKEKLMDNEAEWIDTKPKYLSDIEDLVSNSTIISPNLYSVPLTIGLSVVCNQCTSTTTCGSSSTTTNKKKVSTPSFSFHNPIEKFLKNIHSMTSQ